MKIILKTEKELRDFAANLSKKITSGVIGLYGELGAGKTTFVQGFAKELGIQEKIISPTFVLIKQYSIPKTDRTLYHIDLYRLEDNQDLKNIGIIELINEPNNLILIEWAEKIEKYLPEDITKIKIEKIDNGRELTILP